MRPSLKERKASKGYVSTAVPCTPPKAPSGFERHVTNEMALFTKFVGEQIPQFAVSASVGSPYTRTQNLYDQLTKKEDTVENMENTQRRYIESRIYNANEAHDETLERHFGLRNDPFPKNIKEAVKRIQDGMFVIKNDEENEMYFGSCMFENIEWRNPAVKKDVEGYEAAHKVLAAACERTIDKAKLFPILDAYTAYEEFATQDFRPNS